VFYCGFRHFRRPLPRSIRQNLPRILPVLNKIYKFAMNTNPEKGNIVVENFIVHYMLSFKHLCLVTVSCPLLALIICFVTAYVFQADDIHETHCRVYNIIPSISAITGISPQRYLWRISVAFHIGPRFIIAAVHRSYHLNLINTSSKDQEKARWWLNFAFWLNVTEIGSLCGVTYISNRENYRNLLQNYKLFHL
jgi:hypothetical protein